METVILLKSFLLIRNALLGMWPHLPNKWQLNDLTCSFGIAFMTSGQIDFSSRSCEIWQSYRHQWRSLWYVWFLFRSPIAGQYIYWWWCYDIIEGPDHVLLLQDKWIVTESGLYVHDLAINVITSSSSIYILLGNQPPE